MEVLVRAEESGEPGSQLLALLPVGLLLAAFGIAYRPYLGDLADVWISDDGYSHGPLIILVVLYLFWVRRESLVPRSPDLWGVMIVLAAALGFAVSALVSVRVLVFAALPVILLGLSVATLGAKASVSTRGPILYLFLAMPVWGVLTKPLQWATTKVVATAVTRTGIPANIEGNLVFIPSGTFEIADGCAGTRFVVVAIALATLISMLRQVRLSRDLMLVAVAVALAIFGNWCRVYVLVAIGHHSEMTHSLITEGHSTFSWLFFSVFMIPVFWVSAKTLPLSPLRPPVPRPSTEQVSGTKWLHFAAALAALTLPMAYVTISKNNAQTSSTEFAISWPTVAGDWQLDIDEDRWQPYFEGADFLTSAAYRNGEARAHVFVAAYHYQDQGREADFHSNRLFPKNLVVRSSASVTTSSGDFRVVRLGTRNGRDSVAVFRYFAGSQTATSRTLFKWKSLWQIFAGNFAAGVHGMWIDCDGTCEIENKSIVELASQLNWNQQ